MWKSTKEKDLKNIVVPPTHKRAASNIDESCLEWDVNEEESSTADRSFKKYTALDLGNSKSNKLVSDKGQVRLEDRDRIIEDITLTILRRDVSQQRLFGSKKIVICS